MKPEIYNPGRGLWIAAVVILLLGLGLAQLVRITGEVDTRVEAKVRLIQAVSAAAAGLCLISATARWWMRH